MRSKFEINLSSTNFVSLASRAVNYAIVATGNCTCGFLVVFFNRLACSMLRKLKSLGFSGKLFATSRAVNYAIVATGNCTCGFLAVFFNRLACLVSKSIGVICNVRMLTDRTCMSSITILCTCRLSYNRFVAMLATVCITIVTEHIVFAVISMLAYNVGCAILDRVTASNNLIGVSAIVSAVSGIVIYELTAVNVDNATNFFSFVNIENVPNTLICVSRLELTAVDINYAISCRVNNRAVGFGVVVTAVDFNDRAVSSRNNRVCRAACTADHCAVTVNSNLCAFAVCPDNLDNFISFNCYVLNCVTAKIDCYFVT